MKRPKRWLIASLLLAIALALLAVFLHRAGDTRTRAALPATPAGLDRSGTTLPKTNYPIPAGAVFMSPQGADEHNGTRSAPVRTLNRAISLAPAGGTVVLRGGEYRDWYHNQKATAYGVVDKSLTFQAYPGESPWLNGTDLVSSSDFIPSTRENQYYIPWQTPEFCDGQYYSRPPDQQTVDPNEGPCSHFDMSRDPDHPMAGDPQMVFLDGVALHQVKAQTLVTSQTFYYDWAERRIVIGASPEGKTVEISRRPVALVLADATFRVLGLGFRRYASNEFGNTTGSALKINGAVSLVENSVFTENAALGLTFSEPRPGTVARSNVFAVNGYTALGGNGSARTGRRNDLLVEQNIFYANNAERFGTDCSTSCGAAAVKFANIVGVTMRNNLVEDTQGMAGGLWCDLDCQDGIFVYNTIRNNPGGPAIFYEVSDRGIIAANVLSDSTYGISVASANTKVFNNTLADNVQGINVYDDRRSPGVDGWDNVGPDTRNVEVVNNVISGKNYSLMASSSEIDAAAPNTGGNEVLSRVDHNVLHQSNGRDPVFTYWRTLSGEVTYYRRRSDLTAQHGFEAHGRWLTGSDDPFVDKERGDLRMRRPFIDAAPLPLDVAAALATDPVAQRGVGAFARTQ